MTPRPTMHAVDQFIARCRPDLQGNRAAALARLEDLAAATFAPGREGRPLPSGATEWRPPPSACPGRTAAERHNNRPRLRVAEGVLVTVLAPHDRGA